MVSKHPIERWIHQNRDMRQTFGGSTWPALVGDVYMFQHHAFTAQMAEGIPVRGIGSFAEARRAGAHHGRFQMTFFRSPTRSGRSSRSWIYQSCPVRALEARGFMTSRRWSSRSVRLVPGRRRRGSHFDRLRRPANVSTASAALPETYLLPRQPAASH